LPALLADHGAGPEQPVPLAIETARGLLAAALLGAGYLSGCNWPPWPPR